MLTSECDTARTGGPYVDCDDEAGCLACRESAEAHDDFATIAAWDRQAAASEGLVWRRA